jgi:hypothetical protein
MKGFWSGPMCVCNAGVVRWLVAPPVHLSDLVRRICRVCEQTHLRMKGSAEWRNLETEGPKAICSVLRCLAVASLSKPGRPKLALLPAWRPRIANTTWR